MPERSSLSQGVQIGVELVEGTVVSSNRKLQATGFALSPNLETNRFRPMGQKYDALVTPGKEMTAVEIEGVGTYEEVIFLLSSVLTATAPTVVGVTGQQWVFAPSSSAEDTVKTFTVEQGGTVRAHRAAGVVLTDFGITWNRDAVELSGSGMGQLFTDGITMTASPTVVPLVPILPTQIDVFMNSTFATLGTTKLLRTLEGELSLGSRFGPVWVLNSANPSYVARVETEPDATFRLLLEADAAGMALLTSARAGATQYISVVATGGVIGAGPAVYKAQFDFACKVEEIGSLDDQDGVFAIEFETRLVHDTALGGALKVTIINSQTSL